MQNVDFSTGKFRFLNSEVGRDGLTSPDCIRESLSTEGFKAFGLIIRRDLRLKCGLSRVLKLARPGGVKKRLEFERTSNGGFLPSLGF